MASPSPVHIAPVFSSQHRDLALLTVDCVEHPVGPSAGRPAPGELAWKGLADPAWLAEEIAGDELNDRCCDGLR